ncbi:MAG: outer membrane beta-barrel protein [Blastochloris sp.]|nr:outer membrane beta-barrel protein [Blastochloris sp.]
MKQILPSLLSLCTLLALTTQAAQVDPSQTPGSALDQAMRIKRSPTEQALNEDGGNLNELKRSGKNFNYHFGLFSDIEYQSNANLDGNGGKGAAVWLPAAEAGLTWKFAPQWSLSSTASADAGLYTDVDEQNYWGLNLRNEIKYSLGSNLPHFYAGPDFYRYQSLDTGDEISLAFAPKVGVGYGYLMDRSKTYLFSDVRYQHHFVNSPIDTSRDTVRVMLGLTQQLTESWFAQAYYEYRFSDYDDLLGREDSRNTVGLSLIWEATRNLSLRLNTNFIDNDSNDPNASFQTFNTGLGSALIWRY